jgi:hypothetical protein
MSSSSHSSNRSAWVQLYEARRILAEPETRPPGRPPAPIPRHKVGLTLSQGEVNELEVWQDRFSNLLGRKVSVGESVGILTRICSGRLARLGDEAEVDNLLLLVERMIGASE